jgi:prolyl 4-hydroxylase
LIVSLGDSAARGTCKNAPGWMIVHCCKSCDEELNASALLDFDTRCSREQLNMTGPAWEPGDLDKLFEKWVTSDEFNEFTPNVVSSPGAEFGGIDGPWILTFDTFLTDFESDQIWEGGKVAGFDRSTDQGAVNDFGEMEQVVSKTRTSNNAWCTDQCERMPGVMSSTDKIEKVTGVPRANYESYQILQYHKNQFYRMHHDSSNGKDDTPAGHRILTFFLYLSDVEEGGATRFTKLGLDIRPKKGRALVWPSVMSDDPSMWDKRMFHEARDVIRGEKRAANHWIHLYDYETPNLWGCTGSFS